jgi:predicted dinucleotide-binding enzyme
MKSMQVGVLGTGIVGQVLGTGLAELGHTVMMGARDANNAKSAEWAKKTGKAARTGTFAQAAQFGELIVLATLGSATEEVVRSAGPANLAGRVVMDATNPLVFPAGGMPQLAYGFNDSLGERVQRAAPQAKVVKAFNTVGNAQMVHPKYAAGRPDMFICGNDAGAKALVGDLCNAWDWDIADLGGIEASRLLEPMCLVWVHYGIRTKGWGHAFKLLRA